MKDRVYSIFQENLCCKGPHYGSQYCYNKLYKQVTEDLVEWKMFKSTSFADFFFFLNNKKGIYTVPALPTFVTPNYTLKYAGFKETKLLHFKFKPTFGYY